MKYRFAVFLSLVLAFAAHTAAQERNFDITVALDGGSSRIDRNEVVLKVRITNRGSDDLKTGGLGELNIFFSPCEPADASCSFDYYFARYPVPKNNVSPDRSAEFSVDLAGLEWQPGPYGPMAGVPSSFRVVPSKNIYLYADVKVLDGFSADPASGKRVPKYREFLSNVINVSFR